MFELVEYKKTRYTPSLSRGDYPDKIYLISDIDYLMNELLRIKPKCESEGFNLIISNSCFDVWLYYAYHVTMPNFQLPSDPLKISGKFKGWLPRVIRGGISPKKAILNIHINIKNAKINYREDENGIPLLFSTNMYLLAEDLLHFIEPELLKIIKENKRNEERFRSRNKKQLCTNMYSKRIRNLVVVYLITTNSNVVSTILWLFDY